LFHLKKGDIVIISREGYLVTNKNITYLGAHGYDNNLESMRTIFMGKLNFFIKI
jgi:hypothetical protein